MRNFFYILISLIIVISPTFAQPIQGGVSFDVNSAREYVQEGQSDSADVSGPMFYENGSNVEKVVYSYNNGGEVIGITVQYINDSQTAYIYGKNKNLIYIDKYDKPVDVYPHRGYRYNLDGKLTLTSLTVSKKEMFRFTPDGALIAHSVKGITYDESGKVIGKSK
jgi:hypothetical protein